MAECAMNILKDGKKYGFRLHLNQNKQVCSSGYNSKKEAMNQMLLIKHYYNSGFDDCIKEQEEIIEGIISNRHWFKKMMMYILQL